jgi:ketosteroid isomerase-like protein
VLNIHSLPVRAKEFLMPRHLLQFMPLVTMLIFLPTVSSAQEAASSAKLVEELRATVRKYDDALRRGDAAAVAQFWTPDYTFVNPKGQRLTRAERLDNVRTARTTFDSLAHEPKEEQIRTYGGDRDPVAVYTALLSIGGRYSGQAEQGQYRVLVVWTRRDGRWQQLASQMTPVVGRE